MYNVLFRNSRKVQCCILLYCIFQLPITYPSAEEDLASHEDPVPSAMTTRLRRQSERERERELRDVRIRKMPENSDVLPGAQTEPSIWTVDDVWAFIHSLPGMWLTTLAWMVFLCLHKNMMLNPSIPLPLKARETVCKLNGVCYWNVKSASSYLSLHMTVYSFIPPNQYKWTSPAVAPALQLVDGEVLSSPAWFFWEGRRVSQTFLPFCFSIF